MTKFSNSWLLGAITKLLILLVVAKSVSLALWQFLPSEGVNLQAQSDYKPQYQKVDFKNMISGAATASSATEVASVANSESVTNMLLIGLYGAGSHGFAIVALKSSPKATTVISVGEIFSGYELKTILSDSVVFTKQNKDYVLRMNVDGAKNNGESFVNKVESEDGQAVETNVSREDIRSYAQNPNEIWKDISIVELKNNQGFEITNVRKGSKMETLGLQKGDIMIRANNSELKSYKDAIELYKNIDTLRTINLVVLRNNQEKEFTYEIN
jgi:type II secretion system protein C